MSGAAEARQELATYLTEQGIETVPYVPTQVVPPLVFMRPAQNPYEEFASGKGTEFTYRVEMILVTDSRTEGQEAFDAIEEMVENVLMHAGDWVLVNVGQAFIASTGAGQYPAIPVTISKTITIKGVE